MFNSGYQLLGGGPVPFVSPAAVPQLVGALAALENGRGHQPCYKTTHQHDGRFHGGTSRGSGASGGNPFLRLCCLRLRGLPFSAQTDDIMAFLDAHAANVQGMAHIIFNLQGRPSGEAFIQMTSPEQARQATVDLHLKHMGERYIEVFQCSIQDMSFVLATSYSNQLAAQRLRSVTINSSANNNTNSPNAKLAAIGNPLVQQLPGLVYDAPILYQQQQQQQSVPWYTMQGITSAHAPTYSSPQRYPVVQPSVGQLPWQPCVAIGPYKGNHMVYGAGGQLYATADHCQQPMDNGGAGAEFAVQQAAVQ